MEEDRFLTKLYRETVQLYLCKLYDLFWVNLKGQHDLQDDFQKSCYSCYYFSYFNLIVNDFGLKYRCIWIQYNLRWKGLL